MKKKIEDLAQEVELSRREIEKLGKRVDRYETWVYRQMYLFEKTKRREYGQENKKRH